VVQQGDVMHLFFYMGKSKHDKACKPAHFETALSYPSKKNRSLWVWRSVVPHARAALQQPSNQPSNLIMRKHPVHQLRKQAFCERRTL
jgi:hypothetical protein